MFQEIEEFDDFKPVGETTVFNKEIGKVLEKELSEVEQFKKDFDEQLMLSDRPKDQLTDIVVQYIQGVGDVDQVNICSYQSKNGVALDGWGFNGDDEMTTIDLFLTLYVDPEEGKKISDSELDRRFNWLQRFYDQSLSGNIFSKIEEP